jgi:opacity protein-like surface antigen
VESIDLKVSRTLICLEFSKMRLRLFSAAVILLFCAPVIAQVMPEASTGNSSKLSVGGGVDYWRGDWGTITRYGPTAWVNDELWHGLGVTAEGYSMMAGGANPAPAYKFFVGQGGVEYHYHWHRLAPYAKYEMGFAGLSWPHKPTSTYVHDTRTTWAMGGGLDYKFWGRIGIRADYTYEGFPDFYSPVTGQHHTLDPAGFALGVMYHLW